MTAGFYNISCNCAPTFVAGPGFDLYATEKDTYSYPNHGWTWYNSAAEAYAAAGLPYPPTGDVNE